MRTHSRSGHPRSRRVVPPYAPPCRGGRRGRRARRTPGVRSGSPRHPVEGRCGPGPTRSRRIGSHHQTVAVTMVRARQSPRRGHVSSEPTGRMGWQVRLPPFWSALSDRLEWARNDPEVHPASRAPSTRPPGPGQGHALLVSIRFGTCRADVTADESSVPGVRTSAWPLSACASPKPVSTGEDVVIPTTKVEVKGLEPSTYGLQSRRSSS